MGVSVFVLLTIINHCNFFFLDEEIKKNSFEDFLETCLEEFSQSFRGSVLIIEDTLTGNSYVYFVNILGIYFKN